jgi:hypothetical protein
MPSWLPENNTAQPSDNEQRSLWKIVDLGGGGGSGSTTTSPAFGVGSPEGVVTGDPGKIYTNAAGELWAKETGVGSVGWVKYIG